MRKINLLKRQFLETIIYTRRELLENGLKFPPMPTYEVDMGVALFTQEGERGLIAVILFISVLYIALVQNQAFEPVFADHHTSVVIRCL